MLRFNNQNPCPLCYDKGGSCSFDPRSDLFFCFKHGDVNLSIGDRVSDYFFLGEASGWGLFKHESKWNGKRDGKRVEASYKPTTPHKKQWETFKHGTIDQIKADLQYLFENHLYVKSEHIEDLNKRGYNSIVRDRYKPVMTLENGKKYGDVDYLVGFNKGVYTSFDGLLCPIFDLDQRIYGYQMKTDIAGQKYTWTTTPKKRSARVPIEGTYELPINHSAACFGKEGIKYYEQAGLDVIYLCDGILKANLAAYLHDAWFLGAAGGMFYNSPKLLKRALDYYRPKRIVYVPDAGDFVNNHVMKTWEKNAKLVKELAGIDIEYLDWGQLNDKKNGKDCDEITHLPSHAPLYFRKTPEPMPVDSEDQKAVSRIRALFSDTLKQKPFRFVNDIDFLEQRKSIKYNGKLHAPSSSTVPYTFDVSDFNNILRLAYKLGHKYILMTSGCGAGKSYQTGNLKIEDISTEEKQLNKLFYFAKQHRIPTTETIEQNFVEFPTKNTFLYRDTVKKTPLGKPVVTRAPQSDKSVPVAGNCFQYERQQEIYQAEANINLCKMCKFASKCGKGYSEGEYGYHYQTQQAYENERIRANPKGINSRDIPSGSMAFIDEYNDTLEFTRTTVVTAEQFLKKSMTLIHHLGEDWQYLFPILSFFNGETAIPKFGLSATDYFSRFPSSPAILYYVNKIEEEEELRNLDIVKHEGIPDKQWTGKLLRAFSGVDASYTFRINKDKTITIYEKNIRTYELIDSFESVVFMDATATPQQLALQLGCDVRDILHIRHANDNTNNRVKIKQIISLGGLTKQRSKKQEAQVARVKEILKEKHNNNIGVIDWKKFNDPSNKDELSHFVEGRGSNRLQHKEALVCFGLPNTNLGAVQAEFELFVGEKLDFDEKEHPLTMAFQNYYETLGQAELEQEIGRLRAFRRPDEDLFCYLFTNANCAYLNNKGYDYEEISGCEIDVDLGTPYEKILYQAKQLCTKHNWQEMSLTAFAELLGSSKSNISQILKRRGFTWINFKECVFEIINNLDVYTEAVSVLPFHTIKQINERTREPYRLLKKSEKLKGKSDKLKQQAQSEYKNVTAFLV